MGDERTLYERLTSVNVFSANLEDSSNVVCICMYVDTYIYVYMYTHIYICIHTLMLGTPGITETSGTTMWTRLRDQVPREWAGTLVSALAHMWILDDLSFHRCVFVCICMCMYIYAYTYQGHTYIYTRKQQNGHNWLRRGFWKNRGDRVIIHGVLVGFLFLLAWRLERKTHALLLDR